METDISQFRNRILLTNTFWKFRYGLGQKDQGEDPGLTEKWFESGIPAGEAKLKVYVPSSWNYYQNRHHFYHFGTGWYENSFYLPEAWGAGQRKVTLVFGGANYKTTVWLNGQYVGSHEGGFTKFWFEINEFVKFGSDNLLIVQVDNRYQEGRIPWFQSPDWMNYGGIYRQVYLKLTPSVCLDDYSISNTIIFDKPLGEGYDRAQAKMRLRFLVKDYRKMHRSFSGYMIVMLKSPHIDEMQEIPLKLDTVSEDFIDTEFKIDNARLWSPESPYLYNISFILLDANRKEMDREHWRWGIREFKIEGTHFYLNNKRIVLCGVNHHEDHPDVGNSMPPRLSYNDLNIMKEANINFIRTSHYPHYESFMDLADELGFLILEEVPVCQLKEAQFGDNYLVNAQKQLWEMIHRDKNRTCVIAWSMGNECETACQKGRDFMQNLIDVARTLDPHRYITLVTDHPIHDLTMDLVDFVCANMYTGWYSAYDVKPNEVFKQLETIWQKITTDPQVKGPKPLVISEFGAEAIAGYKDFSNAHWSENYQYYFLRDYLGYFITCGYIQGAAIWHFQDFRCSPFGGFMTRPREYNNKGIVDAHRNPKISYFIIQSLFRKWKEHLEGKNVYLQTETQK
jgi:beta-glucuronidase